MCPHNNNLWSNKKSLSSFGLGLLATRENMRWPWVIRPVDEVEVAHRRATLDRYGVYAQLSALIPIAAYWLFRFGVWVLHERFRVQYAPIPGSPGIKQFDNSKKGKVAKLWRKARWWLDGENFGYGKRIHFFAGLAWFAWLCFLSIHRAGDDYFHVTKRFGIIAASQFPLHYALIMKHRFSPLGFMFQTSHEELNPYHRALAKVIFGLLYIHVGLYWNAFFQNGVILQKLGESVVIVGILGFLMLNILGSTSLDQVRAWNYRVFFITHAVIGMTIGPVLWFHAPPMRLFMVEATLLFFLDVGVRRLSFFVVPTHFLPIPNTNLLSLTVPLPAEKREAFANAGGQHIYLQVPPESRNGMKPIADMCFNPFTIASISEDGHSMQLVLRVLHGPTSDMLKRLSGLPKADPPLQIDGPYGSACRFPNFAFEFDRVLLIAGGVGATFCLPIYRAIRNDILEFNGSTSKVSFVWSMRAASESGWATSTPSSQAVDIKSLSDEGIQLAITGMENPHQPTNGSISMLDLSHQNENATPGKPGQKRPDVKRIVDEVFSQGKHERVAVLVCGPKRMGRAVRRAVSPWVAKGRDVWWHDEAFGW